MVFENKANDFCSFSGAVGCSNIPQHLVRLASTVSPAYEKLLKAPSSAMKNLKSFKKHLAR